MKLATFAPFEETGRNGFPLTGRHPAVEVLPFDLEELRVRRAAAALGISVDTTGLSMEAAESGYPAKARPFFAWSSRTRLARNQKLYPVDTGLRRVAVTATGRDRGRQLESATVLLLRRRFGRVCCWRGRGEIDFVVEGPGGPIPVQVSRISTTDRRGSLRDCGKAVAALPPPTCRARLKPD